MPFTMPFKVTLTDFALCISIETERGLPGLPGLRAAPAAASASRSVNAPAATQPLATEEECVWARTVKRGTLTHTHTNVYANVKMLFIANTFCTCMFAILCMLKSKPQQNRGSICNLQLEVA